MTNNQAAITQSNKEHMEKYWDLKRKLEDTFIEYNEKFGMSIPIDTRLPFEKLGASLKKGWEQSEIKVERIIIGEKEITLLDLDNLKKIKSVSSKAYSEKKLMDYIALRNRIFFKKNKYGNILEFIRHCEDNLGEDKAYLRLILLETEYYNKKYFNGKLDIILTEKDKESANELFNIKSTVLELSGKKIYIKNDEPKKSMIDEMLKISCTIGEYKALEKLRLSFKDEPNKEDVEEFIKFIKDINKEHFRKKWEDLQSLMQYFTDNKKDIILIMDNILKEFNSAFKGKK